MVGGGDVGREGMGKAGCDNRVLGRKSFFIYHKKLKSFFFLFLLGRGRAEREGFSG